MLFYFLFSQGWTDANQQSWTSWQTWLGRCQIHVEQIQGQPSQIFKHLQKVVISGRAPPVKIHNVLHSFQGITSQSDSSHALKYSSRIVFLAPAQLDNTVYG